MKLEVKDLSKTYKNGVRALKDVNLTAEKGMFGLLGANGAGKSTLMRTIATLQDADEGKIEFKGIDVAEKPYEIRSLLGYLPQEFGLYLTATGQELLTHMADMKGITDASQRKAQVEALLQKVNLWQVKNKKLSTYSGGMKQRFEIALALLGNPDLIIVDEPTARLDPTERNRFYSLLSEIGENTVVILSTHIEEDVSTLCNQVAIIGNENVLLTGKPDEIRHSLDGPVWEKQIDKSDLASYEQMYNVISSRFHAGKLMITVIADEEPDGQFTKRQSALQDVYFHITKNSKLKVKSKEKLVEKALEILN
ncbi:MAG: ABC transporter ATP-binding protein [Bacteroidota bacterium]